MKWALPGMKVLLHRRSILGLKLRDQPLPLNLPLRNNRPHVRPQLRRQFRQLRVELYTYPVMLGQVNKKLTICV